MQHILAANVPCEPESVLHKSSGASNLGEDNYDATTRVERLGA